MQFCDHIRNYQTAFVFSCDALVLAKVVCLMRVGNCYLGNTAGGALPLVDSVLLYGNSRFCRIQLPSIAASLSHAIWGDIIKMNAIKIL